MVAGFSLRAILGYLHSDDVSGLRGKNKIIFYNIPVDSILRISSKCSRGGGRGG